MATNSISVGTYGTWKISVTISSTGSNYHKVLVQGIMTNGGAGTSYNNNGVSLSVSGHDSWSGTSTFSIAASASYTIISRTFTIYHTSAVTVSYTATLGATSTTTFGSGGSVSTSLTLPTLATEPPAPDTPTITDISNSSVTLDSDDNGTGGSTITTRYIGLATTTSSSDATWYTASSAFTLTKSLAAGSLWYAWAKSKNAIGTSSISGRRTVQIHDVPDTPSQPSYSSLTNNSVYLSFDDGSWNGGSSITDRSIYWNTSNTTTGATQVSSFGNAGTLDGLPSRSTIYVWARTFNEYGGSSYSAVLSFTTHDVPSKPSQPTAPTAIRQTSLYTTFTDGATNGASITSRRLYWNTSNTTTGATYLSSDGSTTISSLPPGTVIYIWARTYNAYGWSDYSTVRTATTVAGGWLNVSGTWKAAIPYKRVLGVWTLLKPYVRTNGIWQEGG